MNGLIKVLIALAGSGWLVAAQAQDAPIYDQVDLNAAASQDIDNDLLIAVVFAEVEANDQADAADAVNEAITWAAGRSRRIDGIEVQTTTYTTRPVYANGRRIVGWIARQSLRLESTEPQLLSELLGELQQRVAVQSIDYDISDAARDAAEERLIAEALAQFKRRAELIAGELGRDGYRIVRLSVGNSGVFVTGARNRALAFAEADMAQPEIEAGTQAVSVNVNGTIELDAAP